MFRGGLSGLDLDLISERIVGVTAGNWMFLQVEVEAPTRFH